MALGATFARIKNGEIGQEMLKRQVLCPIVAGTRAGCAIENVPEKLLCARKRTE